jgi:hypothetical protein
LPGVNQQPNLFSNPRNVLGIIETLAHRAHASATGRRGPA